MKSRPVPKAVKIKSGGVFDMSIVRAKGLLALILPFLMAQNLGLAIPLLSSSAMGRAGAGVGAENVHSIYNTNPASMMFEKYYSVGAGYTSDGNTLQASVVDTKTSGVGGALSYFHQLEANRYEDKLWKINGIHLALAGNLVEAFSVGVLGKYYWFKAASPLVRDTQMLDFDLGVQYRLGPFFAAGATLRNVMLKTQKEAFPNPDLALGISVSPVSAINILADAGTWLKEGNQVKGKWMLMGALEGKLSDTFALRGGYRYVLGMASLQGATAGLSVLFEKVRLSYGALFFLSSVPLDHRHSVDITLVF
jgi:hypothetical protein